MNVSSYRDVLYTIMISRIPVENIHIDFILILFYASHFCADLCHFSLSYTFHCHVSKSNLSFILRIFYRKTSSIHILKTVLALQDTMEKKRIVGQRKHHVLLVFLTEEERSSKIQPLSCSRVFKVEGKSACSFYFLI